MAKDYIKYVTYQQQRFKRHRVWAIWGLSFTVLCLLVVVLLVPRLGTSLINQPSQPVFKKQKSLENVLPQPVEPKFDFYTLLPQDSVSEVAAASHQPSRTLRTDTKQDETSLDSPASLSTQRDEPNAPAAPEKMVMDEVKKQLDKALEDPAGEAYVLVLGNLVDASEAEQYRAQALLKGFPVQDQLTTVQGQTVHRLFIGPYARLSVASKQLKRLQSAGIEAFLSKYG